MISLGLPNKNTATLREGLRPVNLQTDLGPLADLIELAFADSMDSGGRAAVREMRYLSRAGVGLRLISSMNELTQGIGLGFVYLVNEQLVGNVSIYPANLPASFGRTWIIANVAVHPDYRQRGIATQLMQASMDSLKARGASRVVLQVEAENRSARGIYERLGFVTERAWTHWRRARSSRRPRPIMQSVHISRRRRGEWRTEFQLAERLRPERFGGMGWLQPLHKHFFRPSVNKALDDLLNLRSRERLVIRDEDERHLLASLWIDTSFTITPATLTLMCEPDYQGSYDEALINLAVRRLGTRQPLVLDHPRAETTTADILREYDFRPVRTLVNMRWEA